MSNSKRTMPAKRGTGVNLAWGRKPAPSRGPKPALSAVEIAQAAIQLADVEGFEAVTMQRLGREVGVTTMALYRYFPSKADLLSLMIDSVSESAPYFGKPSSPWRVRLKRWAHRCLAIYRDHPWFLEATTVRHSLMGPNELSWMEAALAMLGESGLSPRKRHHAFLAIIGQVRGHATFREITKHNASGQQWVHELTDNLTSEADRFPELLDLIASGAFADKSEIAFDFGLDCILEGIRARASAAGRLRRAT